MNKEKLIENARKVKKEGKGKIFWCGGKHPEENRIAHRIATQMRQRERFVRK